MEVSALSKKLLLKSGFKVFLINPPPDYTDFLQATPPSVILSETHFSQPDMVIAFIINRKNLVDAVALITSLMKPETIVWIAYPKKTSGIKSDLGMHSWELSEFGLSGVASISINEIWSGIRLKLSSTIKRSGLGNSEIKNNELGNYIDVHNRKITLPPDLKGELLKYPAAISFYEGLSYTNQKEYVSWVLTAKQDKTRQDRIQKSREKLLAGKKNPAEK